MDKAKKNPQLIVILAILLVTGIALAQKFNSVVRPTVSEKVSADEGEDGDKVSEADHEDSNDDEDKNDDKDKSDTGKDSEDKKDSEHSTIKTQKVEDEEDDADEVDDDADEADEEDESGEEIKDITELIAKVEKKISLVATSGGSVEGFNATLAEVRDLVAQAQTKLTEGDKAGAENLIETADDKLENLEESVKLVLGDRDDEDEQEIDDLEGDDDENDTEIAKEYRSVVAQFVHDLKAARELEGIEGGIGNQVSSIAQIQNASQDRVAELLDKIDERNELTKFFIGPNLDDLTGIKEEIAKNQATIQILTQMLGQTDNANVKIVLQRQIQVLSQENLKLENYIAATENVPSMFGWVVRLFS